VGKVRRATVHLAASTDCETEVIRPPQTDAMDQSHQAIEGDPKGLVSSHRPFRAETPEGKHVQAQGSHWLECPRRFAGIAMKVAADQRITVVNRALARK